MGIFRSGVAFVFSLALCSAIACQSDGRFGTPGPSTGAPDQRVTAAEAAIDAPGNSGDIMESSAGDDPTGRDNVKVMEVTIGPELLDCVGVGPRKCLEVNGHLFYEGIDGFEHEEGYTYRLRIERFDAYPGEREPPQDASRYGYRLIEVISKTRR